MPGIDSLTVDALLAAIGGAVEQAGAAEEKAARVQELESQLERLEEQAAEVRRESDRAAHDLRQAQADDEQLARLAEGRDQLQELPEGEQRAALLARIEEAERAIVAAYAARVEQEQTVAARRLAEIEARAASAQTELDELRSDPFVAAVLAEQARRAAEEEARLDAQREQFAALLASLQGDCDRLGCAAEEEGYARVLEIAQDIGRRAADVGFVDQVRAAVALADEIEDCRRRATEERDRVAAREYIVWCQERAMEALTVVFKRRELPLAAVALTGAWDGEEFVLRLTGAILYQCTRARNNGTIS